MNRNEILPRINTFFARFTQEVKQFSEAGLYDINIHSENVLIPLLKEVFGYDGLQNANAKVKNFPAVDLIDYPNRVSIQVTATSDAQKISETLSKFSKNEQHRAFDRIIIYVLTNRQDSYRKNFNELLPADFDFDVDRDVIDNATLFDYISKQIIHAKKLSAIERILSEEFSDLKIQEREVTQHYQSSPAASEKERYFPNLVRLDIPANLFQADINFDFETEQENYKNYLKEARKFKKIRHISARDVVNYVLKTFDNNYLQDLIVRNKKIYTFRNLHQPQDAMRKVIDLGTITMISISEYIDGDSDKLNNIRDLVTSTLKADLIKRQIEWLSKEKMFRFRIGKGLKSKKVSYKSKSGRKVIFEILSKEDKKIHLDENGNERFERGKHIVCFRHLSFGVNIFDFEGFWFMSIKPDWTFTSPRNGWAKSNYSEFYTKGIKEFEWNDTIFDQFTFLSDYLSTISTGDMFGSFVVKILPFEMAFNCDMSVPDDVWNQAEPKTKFNKSQLSMFGE